MSDIDYETTVQCRRARVVAVASLCLAVASIIVAAFALMQDRGSTGASGSPREQPESSLDRIKRTGVLRAGYGGFPPYTIVNLDTTDSSQPVRGFAVALISEIAARHKPPLKIEWLNLNWETLRADMLSGKFDILADGLYQTVPLASDFLLSEPFSYFGIGCAVVRIEDDRFKRFSDLDRSDITIAVAVGWLSTDFAKDRLTKPRFKDIVVSESPFAQLDEVLHGRADVAIQDVPTVVSYVRAHEDQVKALWVDDPPAVVAGGFAARRQDRDLMDFVNTSIRILEVDGTIEAIDKKWGGLGYYRRYDLKRGTGLKTTQFVPTNEP